ncbi:MAG: response regulator, partial [Chthoniobacterales bacterium]
MTAPLSILLIDDEPQIRRLLRVVLEGGQYRVFEAETGATGIQEAASRRPDLILLDLGLPDIRGTEVLRRIREWSTVPVLILSVHDDEEDKVAALDGGADDYVTKPFNNAELLARLRVLTRRSQAFPQHLDQ